MIDRHSTSKNAQVHLQCAPRRIVCLRPTPQAEKYALRHISRGVTTDNPERNRVHRRTMLTESNRQQPVALQINPLIDDRQQPQPFVQACRGPGQATNERRSCTRNAVHETQLCRERVQAGSASSPMWAKAVMPKHVDAPKAQRMIEAVIWATDAGPLSRCRRVS